MNGWMITYLVMNSLGVGIHLAKHGQERGDKYNFFAVLVAWSLSLTCLYMAGAFETS